MLIKFKDPDPRAGTTVRMDSSRGQHFVDTGAADAVSEQPSAEVPELVVEDAPAVVVTTEAADAVSEQPSAEVPELVVEDAPAVVVTTEAADAVSEQPAGKKNRNGKAKV